MEWPPLKPSLAEYAEAGVELNSTGPMGVVTSGAGANALWSDAELHAAMQAQFSVWADRAQWAAWLVHAHLHDLGTSLYGIMFDQQGHQRQGAAVFYAGMDGVADTHRRLHLSTCVHELGHTFNLLHAWQRRRCPQHRSTTCIWSRLSRVIAKDST